MACDSAIYTMDHPGVTVSNFMDNSIGLKGLKCLPSDSTKGSHRLEKYLNI